MRGRTSFVGIIERRGRFRLAVPFFEPGARVPIHPGSRRDVTVGAIALVRVDGGRARVVKELGRPDCARDVVGALIHEKGMSRGFPGVAEEEAARRAPSLAAGASRRDMTGLVTATVDPDDAKDFDDAISVEPVGDLLRVYVHIADVSSFVAPGGAIDSIARERGTSCYVPGQVEPMLPLRLSADACSLVPGQPRSSVTAEMDVDGRGEVVKSRFYRSLIVSDCRFTYGEVLHLFEGRGEAPARVSEMVERARRVARARRERRSRRGALELFTMEPEFEFDRDGNVRGVELRRQDESHSLIEELMIMANEEVAKFLGAAGRNLLYRVHALPDPPAVEFLMGQLESLDVATPSLPEVMTPAVAGRLVGEVSAHVARHVRRVGRGREALTSLVLRALKRAEYSPVNIGHAGLASRAYCHFTSPIRRYPDVIVHRALIAAIGGEGVEHSLRELEAEGEHASMMERTAAVVEREADDVCLAFALERELFEQGWNRRFEGEVVGFAPAGAFVRFSSYEGFLPARRMGGDYFKLNEWGTAMVGRKTGRRLRLGDAVSVRVERIEAPRGRVDLVPASRDERARRAPDE